MTQESRGHGPEYNSKKKFQDRCVGPLGVATQVSTDLWSKTGPVSEPWYELMNPGHCFWYIIYPRYDQPINQGTLAEWLTRCPAKAIPSGACVRITQVSIFFWIGVIDNVLFFAAPSIK